MSRVAVFHDTFDRGHPVEPLLRAFAEHGVELVHTPRGDMSNADPASYDAIVVFVRFRFLRAGPPLDWRGFTGRRVLLEHDALHNYSQLAGSRLFGAWPPEIARHGFDLTIASGREVAERLTADGAPSVWVPKGYDDRSFFDVGTAREGICHFGKRYAARAAMLRQLRRAGVAVSHVAAPPEQLNAVLNRYESCLVCNMEGRFALGAVGRALQHVAPGALVSVGPGIEVMIKNFEVAASGCAPYFDAIAELSELGFLDGETAFVYSDFDELAERLRTTPPDELRAVGRRAAQLARERHTWSHRVEEILDAVYQLWDSRRNDEGGRPMSVTATPTITDAAHAFVEACERGKGWEACRAYCHPGATFAAQAEPLADVTTLEGYADWMKAMMAVLPDGDYEVRSFAVDEQRNNVCLYAVFSATHTGEGGPLPPTGKRTRSDYVYVMDFEGGKIRHMTKIWNAGWAMKELGWA